MIRFITLLLAVLVLNVVPMAATAHGLRMAAMTAEHAGMTHHTHEQHGAHIAAAPCSASGCAMDAALCDWVCAGAGLATATMPRPDAHARAMHRAVWIWPAPPLPLGVPPARSDRPPRSAAL